MTLILGIETSTKICSVAISDGEKLLALKEEGGEYSHAEKLNGFIEKVLQQAEMSLKDIDAVALSKGPGSYTGLRIGVSTAKGLCYSLGKPLIAVDTLQAMALNHPSLVLPNGEKRPRYYTTDGQMWNLLHDKAKEHRKNPTQAEDVLWRFLRAKQLGYKFRRQHPVDRFIPDFLCVEKKLIVEVDGEIHKFQQEEDQIRTEILNELGYTVIRFSNDEVLATPEAVAKKIKEQLELLPSGEIERGVLYAPMLDARRMEVYTALYDSNNNQVQKIEAKIIDENSFAEQLKSNRVVFFGDGAEKCKEHLESNTNAIFSEGGLPSAEWINRLAHQKFQENDFEDVAYFEPYYLKDFIATTAKKLL